jgi:hypothetical protein
VDEQTSRIRNQPKNLFFAGTLSNAQPEVQFDARVRFFDRDLLESADLLIVEGLDFLHQSRIQPACDEELEVLWLVLFDYIE